MSGGKTYVLTVTTSKVVAPMIALDDTIQQWIDKINRVIKYHAERGRTQTVYKTDERYIGNEEVIASIIKILEDAGYWVKAYDDYGFVCFSINWE